MSSDTPSLQTWVLPQYFHTILGSSAQSLHIHRGFVTSRCGPGAGQVTQLFALGLFELPHEELLLLLGLILPSLVTSSRCPLSPRSALTLLDSIMPVLAWNFTVFNRALSFFSTLIKREKVISPIHVPSMLPMWFLWQLQAPLNASPIGKWKLLPREGQIGAAFPGPGLGHCLQEQGGAKPASQQG